MKKILIAAAVAAAFTSGAAMAQAGMGLKAGTTRDSALATAEKAFQRMDQNGDGTLDSTEVTTVLQARAAKSGKTFRPKQVTRTIGSNDGNADGAVTLEEFKAAAGARFDNADTNKNGTIDADEAKPRAKAGVGGGANSDGED